MFEILLNDNLKLGTFDPKDMTVSEAMFSIYDLENNIIIVWNDFSTSLNYKLDIGDSFSDIIQMLNSTKNKAKEFDVQFPSQSFFELWKCHIKDDIIF
jgi:hypothetical protein